MTLTRKVWLLLLAAVATRATAAVTLAVVARDGARNLRMARLILEGDWTQALTIHPITHPLYPVLVAFGEGLTGRPLAVAYALSVLLGGLAVLPLHFLARRAWNDRVADVAAILYAFLPAAVVLHGDAMLEGAFMFFFFLAMAVGWSAFERKSWERAVLAGACAALAWLTRPEGVYLIPLLALAALLRPGRFAPIGLAVAAVTALILAAPYLFFVKAQTGRYGVSASPFSSGIQGLFTGETRAGGYSVDEKTAEEFGEYADIARYGRVGGPIVTLSKSITRILFYVLVPFLALGFFVLRSQGIQARPAIYVFAGAGGYFLPPVLAFVAGTPYSHRYILVSIVLLLPVAAVGLLWAAARVPWRRALPVFLAAVCLGMAVKGVKPRRWDKVGLKEAGTAIRRSLGDDRKILTMSRQIEHYARGQFLEFLPEVTFAAVEKLAAERKVDVVAVQVSDFRNVEAGMKERLDARFPLLGEYPAKPKSAGDVVRVYVVRP